MKIIIVSPTFDGVSGVGRHVKGLMEKLKERGYFVDIISTHNTPYLPIKNLKNLSWASMACLKRVEGDIIHAHNLPSIIPSKFMKGRKVLTLHGYYSTQIQLLHGKTLGKLSSIFERRALSWADMITCVSKTVVEAYKELGFEVKYIPNAVDYTKIKELCKGVVRKPNRIIYVGRRSYEKGYDIFERLTKYEKLLRYGCEFIAAYNRPWEEVIKLIASSTILILPSRVEGLPTTILEAFACGTPVIASNIGGVRELIEDHTNGLLFKAGDIHDLATKIEILLNDEALWNHLSVRGEERVKEDYDWNKVVKLYEQVYEECLLRQCNSK
ncbi:MAG: glycosyltransferase family 4 protein, partial [Nitrososphaerota archaeon]|nr:glycosyltransferase family 4 protein [Nitrososphaerota archaeon]